MLTTAERKTLETIARKDTSIGIPRPHLEKLSRLDLIEPAGCNVTLSLKGKRILFSNKK